MSDNSFYFTSLRKTDMEIILHVFNTCFENYFVPVQITREQLEQKLFLEDIDLDYSMACYSNDTLVGFILHGKRNNALYNAGTGVLPEFRGVKLVKLMYQNLFSRLVHDNIDRIILEVIVENLNAIKAYLNSGFNFLEKLHCFSIELKEVEINSNISINETTNFSEFSNSFFWDISPQWQNDILNKKESQSNFKLIIAKMENIVVGYTLFDISKNKIVQIAVHRNYRYLKIASTIFFYIWKNYSNKVYILNVSEKNKSLIAFLNFLGAKNYLSQYKMQWTKNNELITDAF